MNKARVQFEASLLGRIWISCLAAVSVLLAFDCDAQTLMWEKEADAVNKLQVISLRLRTNTTSHNVATGKDEPREPYFISKARLLHIFNNETTNVLWEHGYIEHTIKSNRFIYPDDKPSVSLKILDLHFDPSNHVASVLYAQDSMYLFCPILQFPPYPGNKLFHDQTGYGDDFCCEIRGDRFKVPSPYIKDAKLQYNATNKRMEVVLKLRNHSYGDMVIFERKPEGWFIKEPTPKKE